MILVVAGPTTSKFRRLVVKIVATGTSVLSRFFSRKNPLMPDGVVAEPKADWVPG